MFGLPVAQQKRLLVSTSPTISIITTFMAFILHLLLFLRDQFCLKTPTLKRNSRAVKHFFTYISARGSHNAHNNLLNMKKYLYCHMDDWIDGLMDCCKSRRYAQNNALIIFKMPILDFHLNS